jgi:hypothetical protein
MPTYKEVSKKLKNTPEGSEVYQIRIFFDTIFFIFFLYDEFSMYSMQHSC